MSSFYLRYVQDDSGTTAIEYGLIAAGIALAILGAINALSTSVQTMLFDVIADAVSPS